MQRMPRLADFFRGIRGGIWRDMAGYGGIWRDMAGYGQIWRDTSRYRKKIGQTRPLGKHQGDPGCYNTPEDCVSFGGGRMSRELDSTMLLTDLHFPA